MKEFLPELLAELDKNLYNLHLDNIDYCRFPERQNSLKTHLFVVFARFGFFRRTISLEPLSKWIAHLDGLTFVYNLFGDDSSRVKFLEILAYRILGHNKVKLSRNTQAYWEGLGQIQRLGSRTELKESVFNGESLQKFNLASLGYNLTMFVHPLNVMTTFFLKQYSYQNQSNRISVNEGDIVLDCGGCWGDTALYFAHMTGKKGRVHVFEFVPRNLEILTENLGLNPEFMGILKLVKHPVWSVSGLPVYVTDKGPASSVSFKREEDAEQSITVTIDEYLAKQAEERLDFIKMDIEGAELEALKGAEKSIRTFRPSLAIAVYHRPEHLYQIAQWIDGLDLGYRIYLDHFTIHSEETMLYASVKQ